MDAISALVEPQEILLYLPISIYVPDNDRELLLSADVSSFISQQGKCVCFGDVVNDLTLLHGLLNDFDDLVLYVLGPV